MLHSILCTFRPGALAEAKVKRLDHYEFLRRERQNIVEGGPLTGSDGLPTAMLIVVDRDSLEAAHAFISREPYTVAGLFESVSIRQWHHVIPEPEANYIEHEYQKEFVSHPSQNREAGLPG
jgi:uncharacterized protein YciI